MKKFKPIIIIEGEPKSIFLEIFFKALNLNKIKSPILLICSKKRVFSYLKKIKYKILINEINNLKFIKNEIDKNKINLIDVDYSIKSKINKISYESKVYIEKCFDIAINLLKKNFSNKFINGPISKKYFLKGKELGITEYLAKKMKVKNFAMLIFNNKISVCPITTHIPVKNISKNLNKHQIVSKIKLINKFYKDFKMKKPNIALTGLNPHCESFHKNNEEENIIIPSIKLLRKKRINIDGPISADTAFMNNVRKKYDVIVGLYHDQVLTPMKALYEFDAINITLGLPFIRISPDHGPNEKMIGKNLSNPLSLKKAIEFLDF